MLVAQGKLQEALEAYQQSSGDRQTPGRARQNQLRLAAGSLGRVTNKVGDVLVAQGKLQEALEAYQQGLTIAKHSPSKIKPTPAGSGISRSVTNKVGDVLVAQGKLQEALEAYQQGLTIAKTLAEQDKSNSGWQRDLSVSYEKVGDVLVAQGKLQEALEAYQQGLAIAKRSGRARQNQLRLAAGSLGQLRKGWRCPGGPRQAPGGAGGLPAKLEDSANTRRAR